LAGDSTITKFFDIKVDFKDHKSIFFFYYQFF